MTGIPSHKRQQGIEFLDDPDVVEEGLIFEEEEVIGNAPVDIGRFHSRFGLTGKFEEALDDLLATARLLDDPCQVLPLRITFWKVFHHQAGIDENASQGVVDFVGNASRELSKGGHLF